MPALAEGLFFRFEVFINLHDYKNTLKTDLKIIENIDINMTDSTLKNHLYVGFCTYQRSNWMVRIKWSRWNCTSKKLIKSRLFLWKRKSWLNFLSVIYWPYSILCEQFYSSFVFIQLIFRKCSLILFFGQWINITAEKFCWFIQRFCFLSYFRSSRFEWTSYFNTRVFMGMQWKILFSSNRNFYVIEIWVISDFILNKFNSFQVFRS